MAATFASSCSPIATARTAPDIGGAGTSARTQQACPSGQAAPREEAAAHRRAAPPEDAAALNLPAPPQEGALSRAAPPAHPARETRADIDALAATLAARPAFPLEEAGVFTRPRATTALAKRVPADFIPAQARCDMHGAYPVNAIDADGTVRWHAPGCPACLRRRATEKLLARAAIAPRFAQCRFDNFIADTPAKEGVLEACRHYAHFFGRTRERGLCLLLTGNPGTGKNHLATAIAHTLLEHGHTVLNATAHEIVQRIRDTWGAPRSAAGGVPETEARVMREFAQADLLIIDEVGRTHQSRAGSDPVELFHVIDARYRQLRPTLVISNLASEDLRMALGEAAFDRLHEGGASHLVFDWVSHRQQRPAPAY